MTPSLKNYGRNDTPFLEICINTKDKSLNDFPNETFHFLKKKNSYPKNGQNDTSTLLRFV